MISIVDYHNFIDKLDKKDQNKAYKELYKYYKDIVDRLKKCPQLTKYTYPTTPSKIRKNYKKLFDKYATFVMDLKQCVLHVLAMSDIPFHQYNHIPTNSDDYNAFKEKYTTKTHSNMFKKELTILYKHVKDEIPHIHSQTQEAFNKYVEDVFRHLYENRSWLNDANFMGGYRVPEQTNIVETIVREFITRLKPPIPQYDPEPRTIELIKLMTEYFKSLMRGY